MRYLYGTIKSIPELKCFYFSFWEDLVTIDCCRIRIGCLEGKAEPITRYPITFSILRSYISENNGLIALAHLFVSMCMEIRFSKRTIGCQPWIEQITAWAMKSDVKI